MAPVDAADMKALGITLDTSQIRQDRYGKWNPLAVAETKSNPLLVLPADLAPRESHALAVRLAEPLRV